MRRDYVLFIVCFFLLSAAPIDTKEASLALRRIEQLHSSQDKELLEKALVQFIKHYPSHERTPSLKASLFYEYYTQKEYRSALSIYDTIHDASLMDELTIYRWEALYQTHQFDVLYEELSLELPRLDEAKRPYGAFYFAETAFRESLSLFPYNEGEQEAIELCQKALPYYLEVVDHPTFANHAKLALAEIYRLLKQPKQAAALYLELAESSGDREALLFHSAVSCTHFDELKACALFAQVTQMQGEHQQEAAYQWMQLLAKCGKWEELLDNKVLLLSSLSEKRHSTYSFYCGMYLTQKKEYLKAQKELLYSLQNGLVYPYDQQAIQNLALCAYQTDSQPLFEKSLELMNERYPEQSGPITLSFGQYFLEKEDKEKAQEIFQKMSLRPFPSAILQKAHLALLNLLLEQEKWEEAYLQSQRLYPLSDQPQELCELQLELILKISHGKASSVLMTFLEEGIKEKKFLERSLDQKIILLAKAYLEQQRYETAQDLLENYKIMICEHPEYYALLTYSAAKTKHAAEEIITYGERALLHPLSEEAKGRLHLYLFNAYLQKATELEESDFSQKAEHHLALAASFRSISLQNRLWLVHRLIEKKEFSQQLQNLLTPLFETDEKVISYPKEALVFIELLKEQGESQRARQLLERLVQTPPLNEEVHMAAQLMHAQFLEEEGEMEASRQLFCHLAMEHKGELSQKALFYYSKLALAQSSHEEELQAALECLKEFWLQKEVESEPLHLEAGIEYTSFLTQKSASSKEKARLWGELIEHFTLEEDIWSKDYHQALKLSPTKQTLHKNFISYMQAKQLLAQSQFLSNIEANKKQKAALALLQHLKESDSLPPYLRGKVEAEGYDAP